MTSRPMGLLHRRRRAAQTQPTRRRRRRAQVSLQAACCAPQAAVLKQSNLSLMPCSFNGSNSRPGCCLQAGMPSSKQTLPAFRCHSCTPAARFQKGSGSPTRRSEWLLARDWVQVLPAGMHGAARWLGLRDSFAGLQNCIAWRRCAPLCSLSSCATLLSSSQLLPDAV